MPRFQLNSHEPAMVQLYTAARIATAVIMKSHKWYGLQWDTATDLFDEIRDATVVHFITYKVKMHRYTRVSNDGRKLNFMDNVLSSCWSCSHGIADRFMRDLTKRTDTADVEPLKYSLSHDSKMPLYLSNYENKYKAQMRKPYERMTQAKARAGRVRTEYEEYVTDCEDLDVTALSFEAWLSSTGYSKDHKMMEWLLTPEERKEIRRPAGTSTYLPDSECTPAELHRRQYQREYRRRLRQKQKMSRVQLPDNFEFVVKDGQVLGIREKAK